MKSKNYVTAKEGPNHVTLYYTSDNRLMIKSGGTWTWRNNNPGNMRKGNYSKKHGRIGFSGGFAVFPSIEQGEIALRDLLKNGYQHSSLQGMVEAYAPPKDVVSRSGSSYLRTRPDIKVTNNLSLLG